MLSDIMETYSMQNKIHIQRNHIRLNFVATLAMVQPNIARIYFN